MNPAGVHAVGGRGPGKPGDGTLPHAALTLAAGEPQFSRAESVFKKAFHAKNTILGWGPSYLVVRCLPGVHEAFGWILCSTHTFTLMRAHTHRHAHTHTFLAHRAPADRHGGTCPLGAARQHGILTSLVGIWIAKPWPGEASWL